METNQLTYIETHAHLDLKHFDSDRESLFCQMAEKGITKAIVPAISLESNQTMREKLAACPQEWVQIFYAHGIHPTRVPVDCHVDVAKRIMESLRQEALRADCVAIGETGLDYHTVKLWNETEEQRAWFARHLQLAEETNKPLILHVRGVEEKMFANVPKDFVCHNPDFDIEQHIFPEADYDAITMLQSMQCGKSYRGVVHCFGRNSAIAREYIALGFALGIGGKVTYDKNTELRETIQNISLEHLVLETDAPYVRLQEAENKRNTPLSLEQIAEVVAEIKGISLREVVETTTENARRIFDL